MFEIRHIKIIFGQVIEAFKISNNGQLPVLEVWIFFGVPVLLSAILSYFNFKAIDLLSDGLVCLSIFVGFLINMLVPFFAIIEGVSVKNSSEPSADSDPTPAVKSMEISILLKRAHFDQYRILYAQIAFSILLSLFTIVGIMLLKNVHFFAFLQSSGLPSFVFRIVACLRFLIETVTYAAVAINFLNLIKIVISSNALIWPKLKEKV